MATMTKNIIVAGSETRPPMLEKGMYDIWKTRIMLYIRGKENGEMLKDSVISGPYKFKSEITAKDTDGVTDIHCEERLEDLKGDDKLRYDSDIKAVNILLLGLPFISEPRESIHSYYLRYAKLINYMNMIPMSMTPMQINTKFVNHLQPECSRFVIADKKARDLHSVTFDQLDAFLKHNEKDAKEVREMRQRFPKPFALLANTYNPPPSYNSNQTQVKDYEWFKKKMILAQTQEARVVLDEEQHDFLAHSLEETDDCENLQLQAITNFKADYVDAYDLNCDNEATSNAIFMENLSPVGSLNDVMIAPRYDSDTLSEVPHYDTYHDSDMLNYNIQELGYIENIVSTNESYDELKGNNDFISYTDYMLTIRDDADNYVPPPVQKNDMMLSVIEQMKSQVEKCTKVNQESKSEIESLTSELERYKDRVRVLGYAVKDGHSEQEAYLNRELYTVINERNRKKNFETLKQESSERYEKNISEIMDLEKAKKELENIVFKMGQSTQTMHMLTKPQKFYDETHKTALGYQNPLYPTQARRKQHALYNIVSTKEHIPVFVYDSKETLILAEESGLKMLEKQTIVNTKLIDYSKLNKLYEIFVPQTQLSTEQLYWSSILSPPVTVSKPKVFPKKLPSTSQVLRNLNKAQDLLMKFDECIKRRTMLSPHEIGSWDQLNIKGAFKKDAMPFSENLKETFKLFEKGFIAEVKEMKDIFKQTEDEVDQCSVAKKSFEIENKQLLINNDRLLEENIASDIMCTYLRALNKVDCEKF
ncbi:hypothetical protein Tco_0313276 [Tanacetum coccineum]